MPLSDNDLMQSVQAGDVDQFELLVRRYRPRLLKAANSKVSDPTLADDLVQETFVAAFASRMTFNPQYAFSTWIWTIFLNVCRRAGKKISRERELLSDAAQISMSASVIGAHDEPAALSLLLAEEQSRILRDLLDELPEAEADALRLRFFGGLKFEEIATAMDSSLSGAKIRVKRGLLRMAELYQSRQQNDEQAHSPNSGEES